MYLKKQPSILESDQAKHSVSEIYIKQIHVNQRVGVVFGMYNFAVYKKHYKCNICTFVHTPVAYIAAFFIFLQLWIPKALDRLLGWI